MGRGRERGKFLIKLYKYKYKVGKICIMILDLFFEIGYKIINSIVNLIFLLFILIVFCFSYNLSYIKFFIW